MYKVIIHLNNNNKAVVFTCNTEKSILQERIKNFLKKDIDELEFENGDVFVCTNKNNINNVVITSADKRDD